jgi:SanA protein
VTRHLYQGMRFCLIAVGAAAALVAAILAIAWLAHGVGDAVAKAYVFEPHEVDELPTVEAAIVLGTAPYGAHGQRYRTLSRRLRTAADLWSHGKVRYLIVSGNRIDADYDEPSRMRDGLAALGVPPEFVYRDPLGTRTWESMIRARDTYGLRRVIVVSERDHLARALFIAHHLGLQAWGYASDGAAYDGAAGSIAGSLSMMRAYFDVMFDRGFRAGPQVRIGVDPPP